ncbi:MAG: hypothetical protein RLZZ444_771 [Pseudomonadota bacterium]
MIEIPVSWGELVDKITILEIKSERIADEGKLVNINKELGLLKARLGDLASRPELLSLTDALRVVNSDLWQIEDDIRDCEHAGDFGPRFIELARSVYIRNDKRAEIKREINAALGSALVEEKSYRDYKVK